MSNPLFHNNTVNINDVWFESHNSLLQQLCVELGHTDRIDEMREKFLGVKLKMKAYKDPNKPKRAKAAYFYFCDEARPAIIKKHKKAAGKKTNKPASPKGPAKKKEADDFPERCKSTKDCRKFGKGK